MVAVLLRGSPAISTTGRKPLVGHLVDCRSVLPLTRIINCRGDMVESFLSSFCAVSPGNSENGNAYSYRPSLERDSLRWFCTKVAPDILVPPGAPRMMMREPAGGSGPENGKRLTQDLGFGRQVDPVRHRRGALFPIFPHEFDCLSERGGLERPFLAGNARARALNVDGDVVRPASARQDCQQQREPGNERGPARRHYGRIHF
ncbi:hypothetical protein [Bradyrhizobium sp. USDA 4350]